MKPLMLFTDGSVDPVSRMGYGAYLLVANPEALKESVQVKRFEETSSTKLELQTLIWALREIQPRSPVTIYTDSQNIIGLPARRERLEQKNYCSRQNVRHQHAELYQTFFSLTDQFDCTLVKVKGHRVSRQKSKIDRLFTLVDRASRQALRNDTNSPKRI